MDTLHSLVRPLLDALTTARTVAVLVGLACGSWAGWSHRADSDYVHDKTIRRSAILLVSLAGLGYLAWYVRDWAVFATGLVGVACAAMISWEVAHLYRKRVARWWTSAGAKLPVTRIATAYYPAEWNAAKRVEFITDGIAMYAFSTGWSPTLLAKVPRQTQRCPVVLERSGMPRPTERKQIGKETIQQPASGDPRFVLMLPWQQGQQQKEFAFVIRGKLKGAEDLRERLANWSQ